MGISVVVPVFNGSKSIHELVRRLEYSLRDICHDYELILVNDGSVDNSWDEIQNLSEKYSWVNGIDLMKNFGQHNALLCGIRAARYERTVTMDDDLQHPPEEIHKLFKRMDDGYDVVYGAAINNNHSLRRRLGSHSLKLALSIAINDSRVKRISAFRIFRTKLRESFESYTGDAVCLDALLSWGARSYGFAEVVHEPRLNGNSNYRFVSLLGQAVNNFSAFNAFPLKLTSLLGLLFTFFGACLLVVILGNYITNGSVVPGFAFLGSMITIFSGVQLFSLGMLGEYISRIHSGVMGRPAYSVRKIIRKQN